MMKTLRHLWLVATLGLLAACATPEANIQTNVKQGYQGKIARLLLVSRAEQREVEPFLDELARRVTEALGQQGIPSEWHVTHPLTLNDSAEISARAEKLQPSHVLTVEPRGITSIPGLGGPTTISADFSLTLRDANTQEVVWKASIQSRAGGVAVSFGQGGLGDPAMVAKEILARMKQDGLLKS